MTTKLRVYIAGPLTIGPRPENIHNAVMAASKIREAGCMPFIPHLFELWDMIDPHHYEFWMEMDFAWIDVCHILVRLPGESSGADREVSYAQNRGIAVFFGLASFLSWCEENAIGAKA